MDWSEKWIKTNPSVSANYSACGASFSKEFRAFDIFPGMEPIEPVRLGN